MARTKMKAIKGNLAVIKDILKNGDDIQYYFATCPNKHIITLLKFINTIFYEKNSDLGVEFRDKLRQLNRQKVKRIASLLSDPEKPLHFKRFVLGHPDYVETLHPLLNNEMLPALRDKLSGLVSEQKSKDKQKRKFRKNLAKTVQSFSALSVEDKQTPVILESVSSEGVADTKPKEQTIEPPVKDESVKPSEESI